jgi:acyl-CoA thioesterase
VTVDFDELMNAFRLIPVEPNIYRAHCVHFGAHVVRGGQLFGQAILAALNGQEGKSVRSIHTVFMRAAVFDEPLDIAVELSSCGESGSMTTVSIGQSGRLCTRSLVQLWDEDANEVEARSACRTPLQGPRNSVRRRGSWELSVVGDVDLSDPEEVGPPELSIWSRFPSAPADPPVNQALIGFMTDGFLIGTAMRPHQGVGQEQAHQTLSTGVLSHTLTFHQPGLVRDWLLMSVRSPYAGHGRSYGTGEVVRSDGVTIASFVQDAMIRARVGGPGAL